MQKNNFFEGAKIYKIFNKDGNAEVFIKDGEQEVEFYLYDVNDFTMVYFTDEIYIDSISVNNIDNKISLEIDNNGIYISAEKIKVRALDLENTIYTYASIKYKENQEKTFYYISYIDDLKIGDYVWIPVRDTSCPGIVNNIEKFSYKDVPFPVSITKAIIRKSSKNEFEEFNTKEIPTFKEEYDDDFTFEDIETIQERVKKLPFIKSQKIEWQSSKENKDGTISMPFPKYEEKIFEEKNIEEFSFEEILSYLTCIIRGERFCDGLIASNLENGTIEQLEKELFVYLIEFTEIDDNNLNEFEKKDIMFFTLAECGAMGEPNEIEIITKKDNTIKFYHTNIFRFDVKKLYSKFSTLKTLNCGSFGAVTEVQNGFIIEKKLPNYLSLSEAKRLIDLYSESEEKLDIRDNAMLHIFLNCGLRLSEVKNLNLEDIDLIDNKFTVIGKGNKERTNYLNDITKEALLKYLKIRDNSHDNPNKHNNPLFLTDYGYRMSVNTIKKIVKRAYKKAGLDENIYSVHTLRHTCATILYKAGCNIRTI